MTESKININDYESEADTCRKDVLPKIYASDWIDEQILSRGLSRMGKLLFSEEKQKEKKQNALTIYFATHKTFRLQ